MPIAFRSGSSTTLATRTNTTVTAPAGIVDGDILVATQLTGANPTAPTPTSPAGWSASFGTNTSITDGVSFNGKFYIFWKRAIGESGNYTFTHTNCASQGWIGAYSGALASGTPLGATSNNTGVNVASPGPSIGTGITTTAANSWLLYLSMVWDSTGALSPPSGMIERLDAASAQIYNADEPIAAVGATGTRTQTDNGNAITSPWAVRMVELLADVGVISRQQSHGVARHNFTRSR
jgi:hypothetical protein